MSRWLALALCFAGPIAAAGEGEWQALLQTSHEKLEQDQRALEKDFQLSSYERWDISQDSGELVFSTPGKPDVIAKVQFVGSYALGPRTWLWAWANESIDARLSEKLGVVRKHGATKEHDRLTEQGWAAEESDGWDMAAVANHLLNGRGVYRAPSERTVLWVVLVDIRKGAAAADR